MVSAKDSQRDRCPACGSTKVARILYGLPDYNDDLKKRLAAQEVILGGCVIFGDDPEWACLACNHRWGSDGYDDLGKTP